MQVMTWERNSSVNTTTQVLMNVQCTGECDFRTTHAPQTLCELHEWIQKQECVKLGGGGGDKVINSTFNFAELSSRLIHSQKLKSQSRHTARKAAG